MATTPRRSNPIKVKLIKGLKERPEPISALTAYDYPTARILDEAGIDLILVGDSLGMVVLGHEDTTHVTMDMMLHHTEACRRGITNAALVADLPYRSYKTPEQAVENSRMLMSAGADGVKLEGGTNVLPQIDALTLEQIPVVGHIGMLPQSVKEEGGYKKKGKSSAGAEQMFADAIALENSGVTALVLESIVSNVAAHITKRTIIPTIGIGSGRHCDGQIRVIHDILGGFPWFQPSFAKPLASIAAVTSLAVREYINSMKKETT